MSVRPEVRGGQSHGYDPYRSWLSGIAVEYVAFAGFAALVIGLTVLLAILFGD